MVPPPLWDVAPMRNQCYLTFEAPRGSRSRVKFGDIDVQALLRTQYIFTTLSLSSCLKISDMKIKPRIPSDGGSDLIHTGQQNSSLVIVTSGCIGK